MMTEENGLILRDLLPSQFENMEQVVEENLFNDTDRPAGNFAGWLWQFVGSKATAAIHELLNFNVLQLFARGWCLAKELEAFSDPEKHTKKRVSVFVGDHKLPIELHPVITVTLGSYGERHLRFTLELTAHIQAIEILIRSGSIIGVRGGNYELTAQLKYGKMKLHPNEIKSGPRQLTREYKFKEPGFEIRKFTKPVFGTPTA